MISPNYISSQEAFIKFAQTAGILALTQRIGLDKQMTFARGGYDSREEVLSLSQPILKANLQEIIDKFQNIKDPFQIQASLTFSNAYYHHNSPEVAIEIFYKVIELCILYYAYSKQLSNKATVEVKQSFSYLNKYVQNDLVERLGYLTDTVETLVDIKKIRDILLGHGSIRPIVGENVSDPMQNKSRLEPIIKKYSSHLSYNDDVLEALLSDIEITSRLMYCRICDLDPFYFPIYGCWWTPSGRTDSVIELEKIKAVEYGSFNEIESTN